jgi:HSP20 family protein
MAQLPNRSDSPFHTLQSSINELFNDFWTGTPSASFSPHADIAETDKEITVKVDLPGIDENAISVDLADGMLTIRGEKRTQREEKDKTFHLVERSSGAFTRSFSMPPTLDKQKVTATFANGELTVLLPKASNGYGARHKIAITRK